MRLRHLQIIALIAAAAILCYLAAWLIVLRPLRSQVNSLQNNVTSKRRDITDDGWPVDANRLQAVLNRKQAERERAAERSRDVIRTCTSMFDKKIQYLYETAEHFEKQVSRLDYQEEFLRIKRKLQENGIAVNESILGMSEDSAATHTYQLILRLWALEAATDHALEHGLKPVVSTIDIVRDGQSRTAEGPVLQVAEPRGYRLHEKKKDPYLLEFPVKLRLRGSLEQVHTFLANADRKERFLSVNHIEIYKPRFDRNNVTDEAVDMDVDCSAYYLMDKEFRPEPEKKGRLIPAGA